MVVIRVFDDRHTFGRRVFEYSNLFAIAKSKMVSRADSSLS